MRWLVARLVLVIAFVAVFIAGAVVGDAYGASNDAVSVGSGVRFICQTSAPSPTGRARLWVRCSDGALMFTSALNVDTAK